uniref:O-antigen ligase family protein n=1 Tax=Fervidobacterium thailandense TaxID=1008305 RepID=A0A7C4W1A8_9BACT
MDIMNFLWLITTPLVSLFAHLIYTDSYSVPKHFFLSFSALITFIVLYARALRRKNITMYCTIFHLFFILFWTASLLSIINTARVNPYLIKGSLDVSLYLLVYVFLSVFFSNYLEQKEKIENMLFAFLIAGVIVAANGLLNYYTGYDIFVGLSPGLFYRERIRSTIGNVIFVANFLNMLMPIALYFYFRKTSSNLMKSFAFVSVTLFYLVLLVGNVRSEYLSWIVQLIFMTLFGLLEFGKRKRSLKFVLSREIFKEKLTQILLITVVFVIAGILFVGFPNILNHNKRMGEFILTSLSSRFETKVINEDLMRRKVAWLSAIEIWKDHKVFGQGVGTYRFFGGPTVAKVCNKVPKYRAAWQLFDTVHNDYLQVLAETGLVGFGLMITTFVLLVIYVFKNYEKLPAEKKAVFMTLVLTFVPFAVQMFFCYPVQILPNSLLALFSISAGVGRYLNEREGTKFNVKMSLKSLVPLGILLLILLTSSVYLRASRFLSAVYLRQGKVALNSVMNLYDIKRYKDRENSKAKKADNIETSSSVDDEIRNDLLTALVSLYNSIKFDHSNGLSYYFLSHLLGNDETFASVRKVKKDFVEVILKEYNGKFDLLKRLEEVLTENEIVDLQRLYSSLDLLNHSERFFADPVVQLAKVEKLSKIIKKLSEVQIKQGVSSELRSILKAEIEVLYTALSRSALRTIYEYSGGWVLYFRIKNPDIEIATRIGGDVYRELIYYIGTSGQLDSRKIDLIKQISDFEREVCLDLESNGYWGIPDAGLIFFTVLAEKQASTNKEWSKQILRSVLDDYHKIYDKIAKKLREGEEFFLRRTTDLRESVSTLLWESLHKSQLGIEDKTVQSFRKAFDEAIRKFISYDFSRYVHLYISELSKAEISDWNSLYATSPWKYFTSPVVFSALNHLQSVGDMSIVGRIFKISQLMVDPFYATWPFLYERYQIFKSTYEYAQKLYESLLKSDTKEVFTR